MKFTKQMFLNGEVVLKAEPDSEVKPEKLINFLRGIDNGRWIGNGKLYYVRESFIKSSDTNPYPELPLVTIDDLLEYGEQKEQWRFKTEAEFKEEYGENWRISSGVTKNMDYLFGQHYGGSPANLIRHDNWNITDSMITNQPLPKERKIKGYKFVDMKYRIATRAIVGSEEDMGNLIDFEQFSTVFHKLIELDVINLWCTPVYEEETDPLTEAIKLLRDLADLQNGAPLGKQWEEMMEQVDGFLNRWEKK